jgi:hypothetical protein
MAGRQQRRKRQLPTRSAMARQGADASVITARFVRIDHNGGRVMDARQFDRWTQEFDGTSRRDAFKLLAAGLVAGPLASIGARGALAQVTPAKCGKNGDHCHNNHDCCNNFKCNNNKCKKKNNNNNHCGKNGDHCHDNHDCCNNFKCNSNNKCKKKNNNNNHCGKNGDHCHNNHDCCNNFKCNNNNKCKKK